MCLCESEGPHVPQMVSVVLLIMITTDTCGDTCMESYSWLSIGPWVKRSIVLWWQVGLVEGTGGSTR